MTFLREAACCCGKTPKTSTLKEIKQYHPHSSATLLCEHRPNRKQVHAFRQKSLDQTWKLGSKELCVMSIGVVSTHTFFSPSPTTTKKGFQCTNFCVRLRYLCFGKQYEFIFSHLATFKVCQVVQPKYILAFENSVCENQSCENLCASSCTTTCYFKMQSEQSR